MTSAPVSARGVLLRALTLTLILAALIAVVGGAIGYAVAGTDGLLSALIGTGLAIVFAAITTVTLLAAIKMSFNAFFGVVLGSWLVKAVLFIALLAVVKGLPFVQPMVLFLSICAAVIGTLAIDVVVAMKSRMPYASGVHLPGEGANPKDASTPDSPPNPS